MPASDHTPLVYLPNCAQCGYPVEGLDRCPECGMAKRAVQPRVPFDQLLEHINAARAVIRWSATGQVLVCAQILFLVLFSIYWPVFVVATSAVLLISGGVLLSNLRWFAHIPRLRAGQSKAFIAIVCTFIAVGSCPMILVYADYQSRTIEGGSFAFAVIIVAMASSMLMCHFNLETAVAFIRAVRLPDRRRNIDDILLIARVVTVAWLLSFSCLIGIYWWIFVFPVLLVTTFLTQWYAYAKIGQSYNLITPIAQVSA